MIAEAFLKQFGHSVVVAQNGVIAVSQMEKEVFDLILMDIHMPEMNGIDATKSIRNTIAGAKIPIIGLTAEAFADRHAMFRAAGMNDILTKPFTENQLRDILDRYGLRNDKRPPEKDQPIDHSEPSSSLTIDDYPIGDPEKLGEFINIFSAEKTNQLLDDVAAAVETRVAEMRQALTDGNLTAITEAAHSIAGMSGSMFAVRLYEEARVIENSTENVKTAAELFPAFEITASDTRKWWLEEAKS